ncbi:carboxylesterase family protein [Botrimarina hoheduenensis]|uniref:carboxylesterase family protein n=1 Tax=Botrimarina hoheduenensis TaxID=2528000 RepID=UPI0011B48C5B|nr:peptidase [Botrimarina hoheduenensis]
MTLLLKDGRTLTGELGQVGGVAEDPLAPDPSAGGVALTPIVVIDDGLRRIYLHKSSVREVLDESAEPSIRIRLKDWQNVAERGFSLGSIGAATRVTPFNEYGRRIFETLTADGPIAVVQGVTEVTPVYTRVQGLRADPRTYVWDQRLATSSIPRDTLERILQNAVPRDDLDARLQVVRLYLQAERYRDSRRELEAVQRDFANRPTATGVNFADEIRTLRRLSAQRLLDEIRLRRDAGQYQLAATLLESFPAEGVPGETLRAVRELLDEIDTQREQREQALQSLRETAKRLTEPSARAVADRIVNEIAARLTPATASRLTTFRRLVSGDTLSAEELSAVAISGWLLGSNNAVTQLPLALQLVRVRDQVRIYLGDDDAAARDAALTGLLESQAATPERIADLLRRMEPPLPLVAAADSAEGAAPSLPDAPVADPVVAPVRGQHELQTDVAGRIVRAVVQLPPEYDPLRAYPTIVTLGAIGVAPERQLDFWAGADRPGAGRVGQATRRGYITIAIDWARPDQRRYEYSAEDHAAVLRSLREAMRRVAIDPDRVYLTGHGDGGDAAWDIALAHPDAWAGVLPFLARADRYCGWYWQNAEHVAWRVVMGELDGNKLKINARELDRYLRPRFDATVVEYRGRGYDPLSDDLQQAFDWMGRKQRGAPPEEFEVATLRPWDNYFWWIEVEGLNEKSMVAPAAWPPARGVRAAKLRARKYGGNKLSILGKTEKLTVWLSPELVNFAEPLEIDWNGRSLVPRGERVEPSIEVLLEDARTRADRYRPYWARVTAP